MAKPLDQFGGWLKFFYIIQWLNFILWGITILAIMLAIFIAGSAAKVIEYLISFFNVIAIVFLCFRIIKIVRKKETSTPKQIIKLMTWIVFTVSIFAFFEGIFYYFTLGINGLSNLSETFRDIIRILTWYAIWTNYFKKSKRVAAYYGANA